jgi:hypothetical protein
VPTKYYYHYKLDFLLNKPWNSISYFVLTSNIFWPVSSLSLPPTSGHRSTLTSLWDPRGHPPRARGIVHTGHRGVTAMNGQTCWPLQNASHPPPPTSTATTGFCHPLPSLSLLHHTPPSYSSVILLRYTPPSYSSVILLHHTPPLPTIHPLAYSTSHLPINEQWPSPMKYIDLIWFDNWFILSRTANKWISRLRNTVKLLSAKQTFFFTLYECNLWHASLWIRAICEIRTPLLRFPTDFVRARHILK